jgi:hypothetical protein
MNLFRELLRCFLVLMALTPCLPALAQPRQQTSPNQTHAPDIELANVLFRYSPELSINILRLRGKLEPTQGHDAPSFNDANSFVIASDAAEIRLTTAQLSALMNNWLLASPKSQLKDIRIETAGDRLVIQGTMKKGVHVSFRATATVALAPNNRIRISVQDMKAAHLPVKGLLDTFGISLDDLISQKGLKGMSLEGDSFLIDPQTAFPPPQIRARVARVQVISGALALFLGQGAPKLDHPPGRNYVAIRGGNIFYGKEEMFDADLVMIDSTPADPFEYYLGRYWCQMVAGNIKVTPQRGLRIQTPDFSKLPRNSCKE